MKKLSFIAAWLVLLACFFALNMNNAERFRTVADKYGKSAVNLDKEANKGLLAKILENNGYVANDADARFIADFLITKLANDSAPEKKPEAILELQKRKWQVPAQIIERKGTDSFRKRLAQLRLQTGWSAEVDSLYDTYQVPNVLDIQEGETDEMKVYVYDPIPEKELEWYHKAMKKTRRPAKGVVVRLKKYRWNGTAVEYETMGYAKTDSLGKAVFRGLAADSSYSVLPIAEDMSFGSEKGTYLGTWGKQLDKEKNVYEFLSAPLTVRLFQTQKLINMRDDGVVTVRTPDEFNGVITRYMIYFLVGWILVFMVGQVRGRRMDILLATSLMLCSGLSTLLMFAINDPLTERVLGYEMGQAAVIGVGIVIFLMCVNMKKFYQDRSWVKFDIFMWIVKGLAKGIGAVLGFFGGWRLQKIVSRKWNENPKRAACTKAVAGGFRWLGSIAGLGYLLTALILSFLLWCFGSEVGGMKVNLNIGIPVQPSEIIKFSFLVFVAVFLYEKGDRIVAYSEPVHNNDMNRVLSNLGRKLKTMGGMMMAMLLLMLLYIFNSDMGPALVVALTFIVLYSMVKSRVVPSGHPQGSGIRQLLQMDIIRLFVGVLTYIGALGAGYVIFGYNGMEVFGTLWLVAWLAYGWFDGKQIYETPLLFNMIIYMFVFGANKFQPFSTDIAERLGERNSMCINTWGTLGGEPTVNTQVAEGLWALASGGFTGQGLGNAQAHYIPEFHTDMVLTAIGETWGFIGVALVIFLISVLLKRTIVVGYRSGHKFLLYLCSGIAIVTGIQMFVIAFGSIGLIPLTGISVPFFSFGRVGMIMTVMAFGVVLSISARNKAETGNVPVKNRPYNLTVGTLTLAYAALATGLLADIAHYQIGPERDRTLVREVYVYDKNGAAVVKYNPRISYLTSRMKAGNIYDRNGILLATSDPEMLKVKKQAYMYKKLGIKNLDDLTAKVQSRYYPLAEHTFFMVGDANSKYYFSSVDNEPFGYLADARHMSLMRGYDNTKKDRTGVQVKVDLTSDKYRYHRFLPGRWWRMPDTQLRDYRALIPFLKEGSHGSLLESYNAGEEVKVVLSDPQGNERDSMITVKPNDISLTMDAELQVKLQNRIPEMARDSKYKRYERHSVVVMDAVNGDILASANYPLPDYDIIGETLQKNVYGYNDNDRPADWKAYTERDLGLTYMSKPGSAAKIMSALAGLMHMDKQPEEERRFDKRYTVYAGERIHTSAGPEPPKVNNMARVGLNEAIVESSNCYFINLVNDLNLYDELAQIYGRAGNRVGNDLECSYKMIPAEEIPEDFLMAVTAPAEAATAAYKRYIGQRDRKGGEIRRMIGDGSMAKEEWMWAWGEGSLDATPASMARVAATAATGWMPRPRFLMSEKVKRDRMVKDTSNLALLRSAMINEANSKSKSLGNTNIGGKSGTPERPFTNDSIRKIQQVQRDRASNEKKKKSIPMYHKKNDGWYIAFIDNASISGADKKEDKKEDKIAVAVRIERTLTSGSSYAKEMLKNAVIPVLRETGYID